MNPFLQNPLVPDGWRELSKHEIIEVGDLFDSNHSDLSNAKANWIRYKKIIGQRYSSNILSIRQVSQNALSPFELTSGSTERQTVSLAIIPKIPFNNNTSYYKPTVKERIAEYLAKSVDKVETV